MCDGNRASQGIGAFSGTMSTEIARRGEDTLDQSGVVFETYPSSTPVL